MKEIKIFKEESTISLREIKDAEELWNKKFPSDFKSFLLKYNGGIPYPNHPTIHSENDAELWSIERFLSIGDIIIQKKHPMTYTLHDIEAEDFVPHNLNNDEILVFAFGDRGIYFMSLQQHQYGQIYFANYSGGDGIVKINTNSFTEFFNSLTIASWYEEEYDPDFDFKELHYSDNKIFQYYFYYTPNDPDLGLQRFKEVFAIYGDIQPPEDGYPNIPQKYVDDRLKLDFLLKQGCSTDGLLLYAKKASTIHYLVEELRLDINKMYKGRYPLQNYLTTTYQAEIKSNYELISELLEMGIEMDWSISGTKIDQSVDATMTEKLRLLNDEYLNYEIQDKEWWAKNGKPSGHIPFKKSKYIADKLNTYKSKT
ncbi:SMI1/KNR4 family protein [Aquimarina sp. TRL1]|uniref:SMI1/KNR4 family protein n=1 Tax=Aquimarina sp. (strain TRL1) TaxID=2736252 RepID=UPI00158F0C3A|nr:SMI1/KNR4 family protein [Aquimarina sp. TRL1]QKX06145.1 SMI1/KNR4 family protein [Aquimarina sp. TRL1]